VTKLLHVAALAGALVCASCTSHPPSGSRHRVLVIAHRGDSRAAPENTLAAFRSAIRVGVSYVELDARLSADGTLYVLHDDTLDRTTDAGAVMKREKILLRQVPDKTVNQLDAGSWFGSGFAGERLPTLAAALDVIQAGSRTLLEQKDGPADLYARLLEEKHLVGQLVVQSFDWKFLEALHQLEPRQPLAALGGKELTAEGLARLAASGATIVAWNHTDLTAPMVADLHRRGYKVWAWTADKPADWQRLLDCGVDGIITNVPGQLKATLQRRGMALS
jgi:glycerophosphoryl diester phosphodiesterase